MDLKKRLLSTVLAATMAFPIIAGNGVTAFANENSTMNSDTTFTVDQVVGKSGKSIDSLFSS